MNGMAVIGVRRVLAKALVAVLCAVCALAVVWCGPASAKLVRPLARSFGSFTDVQGLAVDGSGDVYVYDGGDEEILKFDSSGNPVEFTATKSNAISVPRASQAEGEIAVDSSSSPAKGDIYLAHADGSVLIFSAAGAQIGQLTEETGDPWGEACGVAVDPAGNVYVGLYPSHVNKYVPLANPVTNADYASSMAELSKVCNLAADSSGNVFVDGWSQGPVTRYEASQFGSLSATGSVVDKLGRTLAVDPSNGEVFVNEGGRVSQFGSGGEPFEEPSETFASSGSGAISGSYGIAVDGSSHDVYVSDGAGAISVFGSAVVIPDVRTGVDSNLQAKSATLSGMVTPDGVPVTECTFEYGTGSSYGQSVPCAESPANIGSGSGPVEVHAEVSSLTQGTEYHFRLVVANTNGSSEGEDAAFGTPAAPVLSSGHLVSVGTSEAVIAAKIDPSFQSTTYHIEYGTDETYGHVTSESAPVGSDNSEHEVSVRMPALLPDTKYHARFVATNSLGSTEGTDLSFTTYPAALASGPCPNEAVRTGYGSRLPDCRAYEQVSPVDKNGNDIWARQLQAEVSPLGDGVTFFVDGGLPGSVGSQDFPTYLARRDAGGWSTSGLLPPASYGSRATVQALTPDLSQAFLTAGEKGKYQILSRSSSDGAITPISPSPFQDFYFAGASADGTYVYFESPDQLLSQASPGGDNLYLWNRDTATLSLAGVLPDSACGTPPCIPSEGSFAGPFDWFAGEAALRRGGAAELYFVSAEHAVSDDGDKAFFTAGGTGQIYLRRGVTGPAPETVQVSASQRKTPDPNGAKPASFMAATPSGSEALFTSCEKLTDDSTAVSTAEDACETESQGQDLYSYDAASGGLTDLTVDATVSDPRGADVKGVVGASEDGSYVYFVANGDLDGSGPATSGDCQNGNLNFSGTCSLYVWHAGAAAFIARLDDKESGVATGELTSDAFDWTPKDLNAGVGNTARVSDDGRTLLFRSHSPLTSYDNEGYPEFYRYHVGEADLSCVSCNPSGAPPVTGGTLQYIGTPSSVPFSSAPVLGRNLSASGDQVFFETTDRLLPSDSNGGGDCSNFYEPYVLTRCHYAWEDVYEWEAVGSGSCQHVEANGGCLYLLSSGTSSSPSLLVGASVSGNDVFILTRSSLVPQDEDSIVDMYDVRVGGGLASQQKAKSTASCAIDGCQGSPGDSPATSAPSSFTFDGLGNFVAKASTPAAKLTVLSRHVGSSRLSLTVRVSGKGRLALTGTGVKAARWTASRAGVYRLRAALAGNHRRRQAGRRHRLRVVFTPVNGAPSSVTFSITDKA